MFNSNLCKMSALRVLSGLVVKPRRKITLPIRWLSGEQHLDKQSGPPSEPLVKLLEHKVKFNVAPFDLKQIIKMIRLYDSSELSPEQKELLESLNHRIQSYIKNEATSVRELNYILHLIVTRRAPDRLLPYVEERLLFLLAINQPSDDDIVTQFLQKQEIYDYNTLCKMIILLAELKRRPAPLLKSAAVEICRTSREEGSLKATPRTIIMTLDALVSLSYPNKVLVAQLINDLTASINLDLIDSHTLCNLLRSIGALRWRPNNLLEMFFNHVKCHNDDAKMIDHHVILSLLHVVALVNYRPRFDLKQFYSFYMKGEREEQLNKCSRKWLNYIWTLVYLRLASEEQIRWVLSKQFHPNDDPSLPITHSDAMKLLNVRAIAHHELRLDQLDCDHLSELMERKIHRSYDLQKLADRVSEALRGIVGAPETDLRQNIPTPFGFNIDCELLLDEDLKPIPLDETNLFELCKAGSAIAPPPPGCRRVALIYVSFEDTLANSVWEVVSHKLMISRILKTLSYDTVFLLETVLNKERTSGELTLKLESLIRSTLKPPPPSLPKAHQPSETTAFSTP